MTFSMQRISACCLLDTRDSGLITIFHVLVLRESTKEQKGHVVVTSMRTKPQTNQANSA